MKRASKSAESSLVLHCCGGQAPPPIVVEGWRRLAAFPAAAWESFWLLMAQALIQPASPSNQTLVTMLCKQNDLQPESALTAVGCCEFLLKQAAALDLPETQFQQDLETLNGGKSELVSFIQARFPEAKEVLRRQILMDSLAAHGKVMTDLEWRLDRVLHSSKGSRLDAEIVLLTLHYQEGRFPGTVTLQLTRDAAQKLRRFCDRLDEKG